MAEKNIVKRLSNEVDRLIADHARISAECRSLTQERDKLLNEKRRLEERVRELDDKLKSAELTSVMCGNDGNVERARRRVDALLREVDICIATSKNQGND